MSSATQEKVALGLWLSDIQHVVTSELCSMVPLPTPRSRRLGSFCSNRVGSLLARPLRRSPAVGTNTPSSFFRFRFLYLFRGANGKLEATQYHSVGLTGHIVLCGFKEKRAHEGVRILLIPIFIVYVPRGRQR